MEVSGVRKRGHPRKSWFDGCRKKLWIHKATQTHCYNPVAPAYLIWAYYAHGRQRRCQEDPVGLPSSRLEKTTGSSPHHMVQHHPTGSEASSYAPRSSRFGSEPPSVEDDVDVWRYAIVNCMPEMMMSGARVSDNHSSTNWRLHRKSMMKQVSKCLMDSGEIVVIGMMECDWTIHLLGVTI